MDAFSAALQHLRNTHDKTIEALLLQVDELKGQCLAKEREVERFKEECERKDQQLIQLKKKLLRRNETILKLKGIRQTGADPTASVNSDTTRSDSPSLLVSMASPRASRPTTEHTGALPLEPTSSSATGIGKGAAFVTDGFACRVSAEVDENEGDGENEAPEFGFQRSISSVEAYSPSLLDTTTSETRSLISPQSDKDEGGMSEAIFSPSLLNCEERTLQHSTQMDLFKGGVSSQSECDSPTTASHTNVGPSDASLGGPLRKLASHSDQGPPGIEVPPSDTQYLVQSMNTFPMSPEIGMGPRKELSISRDENKDFLLDGSINNETVLQSALEDGTKPVHHMQAHSTGVSNNAGTALLLKGEDRISRTKQLALKKDKPNRKTRQRTLKKFLTLGHGKGSPVLCGDESTLNGEECTVSVENCAEKDTLSSTTSSFIPTNKTTLQEEPLPGIVQSPRKMQAIPKTTSSPIAPRFRKVVTVVPQTPQPFTSPSSASKSSPREWSLRVKEDALHARPPKWDPEETCLPHSQLDHSGSSNMEGKELADHNNGKEQGKPHSSPRREWAEHVRFSAQASSSSDVSTKSVCSSVPPTAQVTDVSTTTVANTSGVNSRRKRTRDDSYYNSTVDDSRSPPVKRNAAEVQEDVDPPSPFQNRDAVIRRLRLPTEYKCSVPVRRKEDRKHLDARACQQCELWYKDNPERMKQSCRHKELHLRSDTPADFFRVDFTPTQDDSEQP